MNAFIHKSISVLHTKISSWWNLCSLPSFSNWRNKDLHVHKTQMFPRKQSPVLYWAGHIWRNENYIMIKLISGDFIFWSWLLSVCIGLFDFLWRFCTLSDRGRGALTMFMFNMTFQILTLGEVSSTLSTHIWSLLKQRMTLYIEKNSNTKAQYSKNITVHPYWVCKSTSC